jgi:DNA gyrase subunit A
MTEFTRQFRGGMGRKCYRITEKSGSLVGARAVNEMDELLLITTMGVVIRVSCSQISILGRITTGVKIMDLREGETVASFSKVKMDDEEAESYEGEDGEDVESPEAPEGQENYRDDEGNVPDQDA